MSEVKIENQLLRKWLEEIPDPEIPVVTIMDLGIVRYANVIDEDKSGMPLDVEIGITPTYSGCPAMDMIAMQIRMKLASHGIANLKIQEILSPAWTTDWISEDGLRKMKEYGIAPPQRKSSQSLNLFEEDKVICPRCDSDNTILISRFGSTSCKAMYKCNDCHEPFEHFKCH